MNLASRNYHEKRDFIRMKVETPVVVTLSPDHQMSGTCHNLSGGGMLISLASPLPLGTEMEVTVSSHHGHNPMLKALTQVRRIHGEPNLANSELSNSELSNSELSNSELSNSERPPFRIGLRIMALIE